MARSPKPPSPIPDVVMQVSPRLRSNDCAIWSLKTLLGKTYAEASTAARKVDPAGGANGLGWKQMIRMGKLLGTKLVSKKVADLDEDSGVLSVRFKDGTYHAVVLMQGPVILDVDGNVWKAEDYLAHYELAKGSILVIDEGKGAK